MATAHMPRLRWASSRRGTEHRCSSATCSGPLTESSSPCSTDSVRSSTSSWSDPLRAPAFDGADGESRVHSTIPAATRPTPMPMLSTSTSCGTTPSPPAGRHRLAVDRRTRAAVRSEHARSIERAESNRERSDRHERLTCRLRVRAAGQQHCAQQRSASVYGSTTPITRH